MREVQKLDKKGSRENANILSPTQHSDAIVNIDIKLKSNYHNEPRKITVLIILKN